MNKRFQNFLSYLSEDDRYRVMERAAIMEIAGGLEREKSELEAMSILCIEKRDKANAARKDTTPGMDGKSTVTN